MTVNILTVPSGTFLNEATMQQLNERADTFTRTPLIEHHSAQPEAPAPTEIAKIIVEETASEPVAEPAPEPDPVLKRAMAMGYQPLPRRICPVD